MAVLGKDVPVLQLNLTGHLLGAAGAVEAQTIEAMCQVACTKDCRNSRIRSPLEANVIFGQGKEQEILCYFQYIWFWWT